MNKLFLLLTISFIFLFVSCNNSSTINQGKKSITKSDSIINGNSKNRLEVYAFHGTRQCETCKNMKANTKATLDNYFEEEKTVLENIFHTEHPIINAITPAIINPLYIPLYQLLIYNNK